jgi:hypothetical protein
MGKAVLERGYNIITYEGPGQPTTRREQNLAFIVEWEKVVTPVVDYLITVSGVDPSAIALVGFSLVASLHLEQRLSNIVSLPSWLLTRCMTLGLCSRSSSQQTLRRYFSPVIRLHLTQSWKGSSTMRVRQLNSGGFSIKGMCSRSATSSTLSGRRGHGIRRVLIFHLYWAISDLKIITGCGPLILVGLGIS